MSTDHAVLVDPDDGVPDVARIKDELRSRGLPVVDLDPPAPDVRAVVLDGGAGYAFFHEGPERVCTTVHAPALPDDACWWDPFTDVRFPVERTDDGGVALELERRRTLVLTSAVGAVVGRRAEPALGEQVEVTGWRGTLERAVCDLAEIQDSAADGPPEAPVLGLGDWTRHPVLRRFAGTYRYVAEVDVPEGVRGARLDLGEVGEAASVRIGGADVGHALWAPYVVDVPDGVLRPGRNRLEVLVSNGAAVYYEGAARPSGLLGPVILTL